MKNCHNGSNTIVSNQLVKNPQKWMEPVGVRLKTRKNEMTKLPFPRTSLLTHNAHAHPIRTQRNINRLLTTANCKRAFHTNLEVLTFNQNLTKPTVGCL